MKTKLFQSAIIVPDPSRRVSEMVGLRLAAKRRRTHRVSNLKKLHPSWLTHFFVQVLGITQDQQDMNHDAIAFRHQARHHCISRKFRPRL